MDDRSEFEAVVRPGVLGAIAPDELQSSAHALRSLLLLARAALCLDVAAWLLCASRTPVPRRRRLCVPLPRDTGWLTASAPSRAGTARPERFELPTFGSVDRRSIQLSYGRVTGESRARAARPTGRSDGARPVRQRDGLPSGAAIAAIWRPGPAPRGRSGAPKSRFSTIPTSGPAGSCAAANRSGGAGIRTLEAGVTRPTVFKTVAFNRSATPPGERMIARRCCALHWAVAERWPSG
jgi:hypothetical protein